MPGAFAHITAVNIASANNKLINLSITQRAKRILSQNKKFIELGCVSPDYPYLSANLAQNKWADRMHYTNVGFLIAELVKQVTGLSGSEQDKAFAWLCGFGAHVATDITIHPVVKLKVGPYEENKRAHRSCEMNQDTYIWSTRMGLGQIGYADRVRENIGACSDPENKRRIDPTINKIWQAALKAIYFDYADKCHPIINLWHEGFQVAVDDSDESYRLFPLARHVGVDLGLTYPLVEEVDHGYIDQLQTPNGFMKYDDVFDRAVKIIHQFWEHLNDAVYNNGSTEFFKQWNLDTGECEDGTLTAWEEL